MIAYVKKFERIVTALLIVLLAVVVALALVELCWMLIQDVLKPPVLILEIKDLLDIFGFFLLVLIGIELLETVKSYYLKGKVELKVIFTVALIALGRKIITLEPSKYSGVTLIGIGAIILALVAGYYVVANKGLEFQRSYSEPKDPHE